MKVNLKIAGITITYIYNYNNYLHDKIDQYRIDEDADTKYKMEVIISSSDFIKCRKNLRSAGNREYYFSNDLDVICFIASQDKTKIAQQIVFDKAKRNVKIYLNPGFIKNIAEQEYIMSGIMFLDIATREGYLPLHASAISFNNDALVFAAPSQTGKSTQTKMWKNRYLDEVKYINDDKPLLYERDSKIYVAGTPFSGSDTLNENIVKPLKALFFLEQGKDNNLDKIPKNAAFSYFMKNTMRPKEIEVWDKMLLIIGKVIAKIPIYLFTATPDISAVETVFNELYSEEKDEN